MGRGVGKRGQEQEQDAGAVFDIGPIGHIGPIIAQL
jgi:hypothetical protein